MKFRIVVEYDPETKSYAAYCPELPGCCSAGDTEEEALTAETPQRAVAETRRAFNKQTGGRRWLLAGDCSIPTQSRPENLYAVKNTLAALGGTR